MILRGSSGWQTITADLALILFLATAVSIGDGLDPDKDTAKPPPDNDADIPFPEVSSALAVHRPSAGEPVGEWLASSVTDHRQVATISISYAPDRRGEALTEGERLMAEAEAAGVAARLIAVPDTKQEILISVDFHRIQGDGTVLAE